MTDPARLRAFSVCAAAYLAGAVGAFAGGSAAHGSHPVVVAGVADVSATLVVFGFSRAFDNSSLYDPYWSVAPPCILAYFAAAASPGANAARLVATSLVVGIWAMRLTFNWARRWDGIAHEDFRYVDLRSKHGRAYWWVSLFGVHLFPTVLVFFGCLPLYYAATGNAAFGVLDALGAATALGATWIEARADATLRAFAKGRHGPDAILKDGLWRTSRHPNYFGEILFWWGLLGLALGATLGAAWTAAGALSITLLFVFVSVPLMDARMLARRPHYDEHMKTTNAIVPRPW